MESNREEQVEYAQPQTLTEREHIATSCAVGLNLSLPVLLDTMDNAADRTYNGWPERLYVLSPSGYIIYKGGKGPYGFDLDELATFLGNTREQPRPTSPETPS